MALDTLEAFVVRRLLCLDVGKVRPYFLVRILRRLTDFPYLCRQVAPNGFSLS